MLVPLVGTVASETGDIAHFFVASEIKEVPKEVSTTLDSKFIIQYQLRIGTDQERPCWFSFQQKLN